MSDGDLFHVRITDRNGGHFIATLPHAFARRETRIEAYEKGIKVTTPGEFPIYINGSTRQISRNAEVCRSDTVVDPRFTTIGRQENKRLIRAATQIYGADPRRSR